MTEYNDPDTKGLEEFRRLIEDSPLGTPEASALRNRIPRERAERLARRLAEEDEKQTSEDCSADHLFDQQVRELLSGAASNPPSPPVQPSPGSQEFVTFSAVAEIIAVVTGIERSLLTLQTSFVEHLGIEDMSTMVEIAVQIEDAFGVTIPGDKLFGMRTLGDYMAYLKLVAEQAIAEPEDEAIADPLGADVSWWNSES